MCEIRSLQSGEDEDSNDDEAGSDDEDEMDFEQQADALNAENEQSELLNHTVMQKHQLPPILI
jgi:hypothetical protein